jgi:hypothetical protein
MPSDTDVDEVSTTVCETVLFFAGMIFTVDFWWLLFSEIC